MTRIQITDLRNITLLKTETLALRTRFARAQGCHIARRDGYWRPPSDAPGAQPSLFVVDDAGKATAHLNGGRQFAVLLIGGADGGGIGFCDDEHRMRMGRCVTPGKR